MKAETDRNRDWGRVARNVSIAFIAFLGIAVWFLRPVFINCGPHPQYVAKHSVTHVLSSTLVYASDYDGVLPAVQSMASFRALLHPYVKDKSIYFPQGGRAVGEFNFALSGVSTNLVTNPAVPLYWIDGHDLKKADLSEYIFIGRIDGSYKSVAGAAERSRFQDLLHLQFCRAAKAMLPPEYLADADPIISIKAR